MDSRVAWRDDEATRSSQDERDECLEIVASDSETPAAAVVDEAEDSIYAIINSVGSSSKTKIGDDEDRQQQQENLGCRAATSARDILMKWQQQDQQQIEEKIFSSSSSSSSGGKEAGPSCEAPILITSHCSVKEKKTTDCYVACYHHHHPRRRLSLQEERDLICSRDRRLDSVRSAIQSRPDQKMDKQNGRRQLGTDSSLRVNKQKEGQQQQQQPQPQGKGHDEKPDQAGRFGARSKASACGAAAAEDDHRQQWQESHLDVSDLDQQIASTLAAAAAAAAGCCFRDEKSFYGSPLRETDNKEKRQDTSIEESARNEEQLQDMAQQQQPQPPPPPPVPRTEPIDEEFHLLINKRHQRRHNRRLADDSTRNNNMNNNTLRRQSFSMSKLRQLFAHIDRVGQELNGSEELLTSKQTHSTNAARGEANPSSDNHLSSTDRKITDSGLETNNMLDFHQQQQHHLIVNTNNNNNDNGNQLAEASADASGRPSKRGSDGESPSSTGSSSSVCSSSLSVYSSAGSAGSPSSDPTGGVHSWPPGADQLLKPPTSEDLLLMMEQSDESELSEDDQRPPGRPFKRLKQTSETSVLVMMQHLSRRRNELRIIDERLLNMMNSCLNKLDPTSNNTNSAFQESEKDSQAGAASCQFLEPRRDSSELLVDSAIDLTCPRAFEAAPRKQVSPPNQHPRKTRLLEAAEQEKEQKGEEEKIELQLRDQITWATRKQQESSRAGQQPLSLVLPKLIHPPVMVQQLQHQQPQCGSPFLNLSAFQQQLCLTSPQMQPPQPPHRPPTPMLATDAAMLHSQPNPKTCQFGQAPLSGSFCHWPQQQQQPQPQPPQAGSPPRARNQRPHSSTTSSQLDLLMRQQQQQFIVPNVQPQQQPSAQQLPLITYKQQQQQQQLASDLIRPIVEKMSSFRCHVCHSCFEDRHRLQQHLSIHLELQPSWFEERTIKETMAQYELRRGDYLCQICQLRHETTAEFDKHMQLHGDKPHQCELCMESSQKMVSFRFFRQLLTHLRSHCFLYSCKFAPECKQTANRKDYLKLHILKHHLNNKLPDQHTICCH